MIMLVYITVYKDFMMNYSHYHEIFYEHKILKINFLKLCSLNLIFCYNRSVYNDLSENVHLIHNFFMFYIFYNMCLDIIIDVKHIKKMNNFKKYIKNHVYKSELTISNYEI